MGDELYGDGEATPTLAELLKSQPPREPWEQAPSNIAIPLPWAEAEVARVAKLEAENARLSSRLNAAKMVFEAYAGDIGDAIDIIWGDIE